MGWKQEYQANRDAKELANPELRERRLRMGREYQAEHREEKKAYLKEYAKKNPEKYRRSPEQQEIYNETRRKKYAEDEEFREKLKKQARDYQTKNPQMKKTSRIKAAYGITLDQVSAMMDAQNHQCAICGYSDKSKKTFFPLVDHCHTTMKIRGMLCMNCNQALGKFKDSTELLKKAIHYLESRSGLSGAT